MQTRLYIRLMLLLFPQIELEHLSRFLRQSFPIGNSLSLKHMIQGERNCVWKACHIYNFHQYLHIWAISICIVGHKYVKHLKIYILEVEGLGLDMLHFNASKTKLMKDPMHALSLNLSTVLFESNKYSFLGDLHVSSTEDLTFC